MSLRRVILNLYTSVILLCLTNNGVHASLYLRVGHDFNADHTAYAEHT